MCQELIGMKVRKRSNKPFQNGEKVVTVSGCIVHPITNRTALTFSDCPGFVELKQCMPAEEKDSGNES